MVRAFVGSGGKTTLLKEQAAAYRKQGLKVFVTTTTHMFREEDTLLTDDAKVIIRELEEKGYAMAGLPHGEKIRALSLDTYREVCRHADVVLVEADGSKHMPIKFPNSTEPVLYDDMGEIVVVCGLHALGRPAREVSHRLELVKACLGIGDDALITPEHIRKLVWEGYVLPLRAKYPEKTVSICPSHDGSPEQRSAARYIAAEPPVNMNSSVP